MTRGLIVSWLPRLGYGFIRPKGPHNGKDIYFHVTVVEGGDAAVYKFATVDFELNPHGGARPSATRVRVLMPETEQPTSAPVPKPVTMVRAVATPAPAPKPVDARELPPQVARALGLLDEPEHRQTKRERLQNSAHGR